MTQTQRHEAPARSPAELLHAAAEQRRRGEWESLAALAVELPPHWGTEWLPLADEVAFAFSQLGRCDAARDLLLHAHELQPTHRRASALAYVHYDGLLRHKVRKPRLDEPEPYRKGFERWIAEALRLKPDAIVDRYRTSSMRGLRPRSGLHVCATRRAGANDESVQPRLFRLHRLHRLQAVRCR